MPHPEEYRRRAQECVELAQHVGEPDRQRLLHIAKVWLSLADDTFEEELLEAG